MMLVNDDLNLLSDIALIQEDNEAAKELLQESLELARYSGDRAREANVVYDLGLIAYEMGELDEAEKLCQESLRICRNMNFHGLMGVVTCLIGNVALARGAFREAVENYHVAFESAFKSEEVSEDWLFVACLSYLAIFLAQAGVRETAVELATLTINHPAIHPYMKSKITKLLEELQDEMSEEDFTELRERGRERDLAETAKEMLDLLEKGDLGDKILQKDQE